LIITGLVHGSVFLINDVIVAVSKSSDKLPEFRHWVNTTDNIGA